MKTFNYSMKRLPERASLSAGMKSRFGMKPAAVATTTDECPFRTTWDLNKYSQGGYYWEFETVGSGAYNAETPVTLEAYLTINPTHSAFSFVVYSYGLASLMYANDYRRGDGVVVGPSVPVIKEWIGKKSLIFYTDWNIANWTGSMVFNTYQYVEGQCYTGTGLSEGHYTDILDTNIYGALSDRFYSGLSSDIEMVNYTVKGVPIAIDLTNCTDSSMLGIRYYLMQECYAEGASTIQNLKNLYGYPAARITKCYDIQAIDSAFIIMDNNSWWRLNEDANMHFYGTLYNNAGTSYTPTSITITTNHGESYRFTNFRYDNSDYFWGSFRSETITTNYGTVCIGVRLNNWHHGVYVNMAHPNSWHGGVTATRQTVFYCDIVASGGDGTTIQTLNSGMNCFMSPLFCP